jgi:dCMP deaminase
LKRSNALPWDDYFMSVAFLSSMRSKDPSTQVGACIVNPDKRIVGIGYNGFPRGCSDDELPWDREAANELDTKYPYVCHAEVNAILNKNSAEVNGCIVSEMNNIDARLLYFFFFCQMYVALFPCNECAKVMIQSGIREIVYVSDKYHNNNNMVASRRLLDMAGVSLLQRLHLQFVNIFAGQISPIAFAKRKSYHRFLNNWNLTVRLCDCDVNHSFTIR